MKAFRLYPLLALLLMAGRVNLKAQNDFYFTYETANSRFTEGGPCLEVSSENTKEHFFLVSAFDFSYEWIAYEQNHAMPAKILKLSPEMNLLGEMVIGEEGRRSTITGIYFDPENDAQYIAVGKIHDNELHYDRPYIVRFDGDLNVLWQKEVELPQEYCKFFFKPKSFMDNQNDIVYMTEVYDIDTQMNHPYLYLRFSLDGVVQAIGSVQTSLFNTGGVFEYKDGSGDYGVCNSQWCYIQRLNRDFEPIGQRNIVYNVHLDDQGEVVLMSRYDQSTVLSMPDSSLFIAAFGVGWFYPEPVPGGTVLMKLRPSDTLPNIYADDFDGLFLSDYFDENTEAINQIKGLDIKGDYLFLCYGVFGDDEIWNSRFCVTKLTLGLDVVWQRIYDLDNRITPHYIMATQDGGCLVTGEIATGSPEEEGMMMFAAKIDSDGCLDVPEIGSVKQTIGCYPNPAKEKVTINGIEAAEVQVYNALGQLVKSERNSNEISVEGLAEGVYLVRIMDAEGKVYTNKITKR